MFNMDYQIQSVTGSTGINEDIAEHVNNYFWVIDGARSFDGSGLVFARNFSRKLRGVVVRAEAEDLRELVAEAISQVSPVYKGTATIALARINEYTVDYFVLGDCFISTDSQYITDDRLSTVACLERAVHESLRTEESHKALLAEESKFRNRDGGFWVLEAGKTNVVNSAIVGTFSHQNFTLGSDGAIALVGDIYSIRGANLRALVSGRKVLEHHLTEPQTVTLANGEELELVKSVVVVSNDVYYDDATMIDIYLP